MRGTQLQKASRCLCPLLLLLLLDYLPPLLCKQEKSTSDNGIRGYD